MACSCCCSGVGGAASWASNVDTGAMAHSTMRLDFAKRFIRNIPLQTMEGGEGSLDTLPASLSKAAARRETPAMSDHSGDEKLCLYGYGTRRSWTAPFTTACGRAVRLG